MGQTKRAQKNESSIPKHYQNCASKDLCFQWSLVTLVCLQIGTPKKIRGFSCFSHGSPIQGEPWGPTRNKCPASRQQTGVPQHLCGLHLGKGKSAGKTCYLKRRTIFSFKISSYSDFCREIQPNRSFGVCKHHWNLPKTSRHEMFLPGAPPHGGRSAGRAARIAPWCPSSWMLRWDMWYLGVPETGGISQNCCFLREIWWLYEWPLDFGVSCFQTKPICLSAFRHVFPCP
jgi:hypothetical protein